MLVDHTAWIIGLNKRSVRYMKCKIGNVCLVKARTDLKPCVLLLRTCFTQYYTQRIIDCCTDTFCNISCHQSCVEEDSVLLEYVAL